MTCKYRKEEVRPCKENMNVQRNFLHLINLFKPQIPSRQYAVKSIGSVKLKKAINIEESNPLEVEQDTQKLVTELCGSNLLAEGGENVKIKPDSEYPEWLWKLHFGKPLPLEKLDPSTKNYWNRVGNIRRRQEKMILRYQKYRTLQK